MQITKGYFDFNKGSISIYIDNQYFDKKSHLETLKNIFQIVASNPQVLKDETVAPIIYEIMSIAGVNPVKFLANIQPTPVQSQIPVQIVNRKQQKADTDINQYERLAGINKQTE